MAVPLGGEIEDGDSSPYMRKLSCAEVECQQQLLVSYDWYIDNSHLLGIFNPDIFKRWKAYIQKKDEIRKPEFKELFAKIDKGRRGVVKAETILEWIEDQGD